MIMIKFNLHFWKINNICTLIKKQIKGQKFTQLQGYDSINNPWAFFFSNYFSKVFQITFILSESYNLRK